MACSSLPGSVTRAWEGLRGSSSTEPNAGRNRRLLEGSTSTACSEEQDYGGEAGGSPQIPHTACLPRAALHVMVRGAPVSSRAAGRAGFLPELLTGSVVPQAALLQDTRLWCAPPKAATDPRKARHQLRNEQKAGLQTKQGTTQHLSGQRVTPSSPPRSCATTANPTNPPRTPHRLTPSSSQRQQLHAWAGRPTFFPPVCVQV